MSYFPFFVDLEGVPGLVIGGGTVALRKIEKLLPFGPRLTVAAPEILPDIAALPGLTLLRRDFQPEDLTGTAFVIAAAEEQANRRAAALCKARNIPVNAADDPEACTFLFPALVRRGPLTIGISTSGASPAAAAYLRAQTAAALPENIEEILEYLAAVRPAVKGCSDAGAVFRRLLEACLARGGGLSDTEFRKALEDSLPYTESRKPLEDSLPHSESRKMPEDGLPHSESRKAPEDSLPHSESRKPLEDSLPHTESRKMPEDSLPHTESRKPLEDSLPHTDSRKPLEDSLPHTDSRKPLEDSLPHTESRKALEDSHTELPETAERGTHTP